MMITAPFNFVPLSDRVFFPPWAEKISHDIPFEESLSGMIDISITAKSPIFIRNGEDEKEFCNYNGRYFIPGSSVKGMVRNVLEIMSFGKMSQVDDDTYAVRDLSSAKNFYMTQMNQHNHTTYCGWLKKGDDGYIIEDCGVPGRIHHRQIDYALGVDFASRFHPGTFDPKDDKQKTSQYKYDLVGGKIHTITVGDMYRSSTNSKYDLREFYKYDKHGKKRAKLVLTGQPTARKDNGKMGDGKGFEFLFFDPQKERKVTRKVFEDFKFAYFDGRDTEPKESPDWRYWKDKLAQGEKVPVFFQTNGNTVIHFGLSYLYKLPYKHSVADGIPLTHRDEEDERLDMAESIFGFIDGKQALKGRVQFSHFQAAEGTVRRLPLRTEILGTPRASYYPIYVRQDGDHLYTTFMDDPFSISGWKRYPIHRGSQVKRTEDTGNEKVGTTFAPLDQGVVFHGKMRYHNLKRAELGALLSALTFHNTLGTYHNIGMAKSLGYGKITIAINGVDDITLYLREFEWAVSEQIVDWSSSEQLKELLSMAVEQNNQGNSKLQYMPLEAFAKSKSGSPEYLRKYTQLDGIRAVVPSSLLSEEQSNELLQRNALFKTQEQKYKEEQKRKKEYENAYNMMKNSRNADQIKGFLTKYKTSPYLTDEAVKEAERILSDIEHDILAQKAKIRADEIHAKWLSIQKTDPKYLKKALEDFITHFPDAPDIKEARAKLEALQPSSQSKAYTVDELVQAQDGKRFKAILEKLELDEQHKIYIQEYAISLCRRLKGNKKKNFFKEAQLARLVSKEVEDAVKAACKP